MKCRVQEYQITVPTPTQRTQAPQYNTSQRYQPTNQQYDQYFAVYDDEADVYRDRGEDGSGQSKENFIVCTLEEVGLEQRI